jgi:hypothetical protein
MSVWSSFQGTISMRTGCGCSVSEAAKSWFDESSIKATQTRKDHVAVTTELDVVFADDGETAARRIQGFINLLKSYDEGVRADFQADIRFVA